MKKVAVAFLVILILIGSSIACFRYKEQKDIEEQEAEYTQMRQTMNLAQIASEDEPLSVVPVDFAKWQQENPDIYSWITIPGTDIDDPILQSSEDGKYLNCDVYGQVNSGGAIYSEQVNQRDFSDMLTVLYGRSTVADGRFTELLNYEDESYLQEHNLIVVYTPSKIIYYQIFAAYRYDDRHLLKSFDCSSQTVYNAYIKGVLEQRSLYACIDSQVTPQWPQKILTLSTGHPSGENYRYLVQAVEIKEQIM